MGDRVSIFATPKALSWLQSPQSYQSKRITDSWCPRERNWEERSTRQPRDSRKKEVTGKP